LASLMMILAWIGVALLGSFCESEALIIFGGSLALFSALTALGFGVAALVALRRVPRRGTGFAVLAVVVSAWVLSLSLCYLAGVMFQSEGMLFVMIVVKDLPFGAALIWCLRSAVKGAVAKKVA
jgi:hypothetical protein